MSETVLRSQIDAAAAAADGAGLFRGSGFRVCGSCVMTALLLQQRRVLCCIACTAAHGVRCGATWFRVGEEANRITSDNFGSGCLRVVLPEAAEHRRDLRVGISAQTNKQTNKQTNRTHSSTGSDKKAHRSEAPACPNHAHERQITRAHARTWVGLAASSLPCTTP